MELKTMIDFKAKLSSALVINKFACDFVDLVLSLSTQNIFSWPKK